MKNIEVLIMCSLNRATMDKINFLYRNIKVFYVEWGKSAINKLYTYVKDDYLLSI